MLCDIALGKYLGASQPMGARLHLCTLSEKTLGVETYRGSQRRGRYRVVDLKMTAQARADTQVCPYRCAITRLQDASRPRRCVVARPLHVAGLAGIRVGRVAQPIPQEIEHQHGDNHE